MDLSHPWRQDGERVAIVLALEVERSAMAMATWRVYMQWICTLSSLFPFSLSLMCLMMYDMYDSIVFSGGNDWLVKAG